MTSRFGRKAVGLALFGVLVGCGGTQNAMTSQGVSAASLANRASWMKPEASGDSLLYVSAGANVYIYSYPGESLVGTLTGFYNALGLCSDAKGNVWITDQSHEMILEYKHGGTKPIAQVSDPYSNPAGCAVDSRTGNLAVANSNGDVAIFAGATGTPTFYPTKPLTGGPVNVTYDKNGNLYISANLDRHHISWLPYGGSSVSKMHLRPTTPAHHIGLQYDGQYLTYLSGGIYQYSLNGSKGKNKHIVTLYNVCCTAGYFIHGSVVFVTGPYVVYTFNYPAGGYYTSAIANFTSQPYGLTVSVAPTHSRIRK
jgi:hypothetical protein